MDLLNLVQRVPVAPPSLSAKAMNKFGAKVVLPDVTFPVGGSCLRSVSAFIRTATAHEAL